MSRNELPAPLGFGRALQAGAGASAAFSFTTTLHSPVVGRRRSKR